MKRISRVQKRFILVGATNSLIDYGIFIGLTLLGLHPVIANMLATATAFLFSFIANKRYTFAHIEGKVVRQFVLFVSFTLVGLWVIQPIIITFSINSLQGLDLDRVVLLTIAKILGIGGSMVWNYLAYTRVVFRSQK